MKKVVFGLLVVGAAASLVACGGGGGGGDAAAAPSPAVVPTPVAKFNNYEGVWKEGCTIDRYLQVGNFTGPMAYHTRSRTVQMTSPLAGAAVMTMFSYVDQLSIFDNKLCAGEPKLKITSPGDFTIFGGHNTTIDGLPAERASMTVYSGTAEGGYSNPADGGFTPFVLNTIYFPQPTTADLTYMSQAVIAKTVLQLDGNKWYFVTPIQTGDLYPTTILKQYVLTKS